MPAKRGRPRKKIIKVDPALEVAEREDDEPLVVEDHVVTKRYRTKKRLHDDEPAEDEPQQIEVEGEPPLTPQEEEEDKLLDMFRREGGDGNGITIKVFKLLDSSGKLKAGNFLYCGKISLTEDYLSDIQAQFGGGNYRLHLIKGGYMHAVRMVSVAQPMQYDPSKQPTTQHGNAIPLMAGAPPAPPAIAAGAMDGLKQALEIYKDVKKLVEPPALAQKLENPTNGNISITHAMLRLIEDDERALQQVQRRLFGAESGAGTDWAGVIEKGMAMLPMIMQGLGGMLGKTPAAAAVAPMPEPQRSPLIGPNLEQFYMRLLDAMAASADVNTTAVEIAALARADAQVLNIVDAMTRETIPQLFASLAQAPQFMPALTPAQRGALQRPRSDEWLDTVLTRLSEILFPEDSLAPATAPGEGAPPDANIN